jgi:hypothetical protein
VGMQGIAGLECIGSIRLVSSSSPHGLHSAPLLIGCIRLVSSSSPHRLHSSHLLIFSASSAFGSSPHLVRTVCIRLVSSSSPATLGVSGPLQRMRLFLSKRRLRWSGVSILKRRAVNSSPHEIEGGRYGIEGGHEIEGGGYEIEGGGLRPPQTMVR